MTTVADFTALTTRALAQPLRATGLDTIQVNMGRTCDLACRHCHLESGPRRTETMSDTTMAEVLTLARMADAGVLDITGGAPELHPRLRTFVAAADAEGLRILVRTNLTALGRQDSADLPGFFRKRRVHLIASLPCYLPANVDAQRGPGVYDRSIAALQMLNGLGYGIEPDLPLDLVFNPGDAVLPPRQDGLEATYRRELAERHKIRFTRLLTMVNMPLGRFARDLERSGELAAYRDLLAGAFNPEAVAGLMCRRQVSVDWDGRLHDCDFHLARGVPLAGPAPRRLTDIVGRPETEAREALAALRNRAIAVDRHCFGCTAGRGSSCGGALA